ncbi:MAG: NAD(P)-binding domain-containing protein [Solirubrobacteraceae bacterium]
MAVFAFIGFGELGSSLAEGLGRSGANLIRAYTPERSQPAATAALEGRLRRSGAQRSASLEEAVAGATAVLSVVPADASRAVVELCAPLLDTSAYYVDLAPAPVADKQAGAALVAQAGALYVDAAVLGTVAMSGFEVPILASGPGARGWQTLVDPEGLVVEAIYAPAGHATLLKLLRSVYMKGREALILEMMLAARRYGLEDRVAESIHGPGEQVPFAALAERVLCALAVHAERRADELLASSEVVRAAGVDPVITCAGSEVLRRLAEFELRDTFDRERPSSGKQVLAAIDGLSGGRKPGEG